MTARGLTTVLLGVALLSATAVPPAAATVSRVTVQSRQDVLGGRPFGTVGGYEKLVGVVEFALDPANAANAAIVDLARAPRDRERPRRRLGELHGLAPQDDAA